MRTLVISASLPKSNRDYLVRPALPGLLCMILGTVAAPLLTACATGVVNANLGVQAVPSIIDQPVSQSVVTGQNAGFGVSVGGNPPFSYQWYMNGQAIAGATGNTYILPSATLSQSGSKFYVIVNDASGSTTSTTALLTVTSPGGSSGTGSGGAGNGTLAMACVPTSPGFGGTVTVTPIFSTGTAVLGSTGTGSSDISASATSGTAYTSAPVTAPTTYTLTVTGLSGATTTTTETCKVAPTAVTVSGIQPNGSTVAPGTLSFTASVSGGATDTLTWTATGGSFSGNAWSTPTTPGTYTVTATSADNPAVHSATNITISGPVITKQPVSAALCSSASGTLATTANYAGSYQWMLNGSPIPGATSSTYMIPSASEMDAGAYTVNVINGAGTVTSQAANVTVGSSIATNPSSTTVALLQPATFSVAAVGKSPFTYQWFVEPANASSYLAIPGATASSYSTTAVSDSSGNQYYATAKDGCGTTLTTQPAMLTLNNIPVPPIITLQPVSQAVPVGGTVTLRTDTTSVTPVTYQWYVVPAGSTTGTAIPGATGVSYTVPATSTNLSNDQDGYYEVITNPSGIDVSATATIAVGPGILMTAADQPLTVSESPGEEAVFSVNASSTAPLSYQWYQAAPGSSTFTAILGAYASSYTIPATTADQNGSNFRVVVSNGVTASVTSNNAGLFVGQYPLATDLCDSWISLGYATQQQSCSYQLTPAKANVEGAVMWPTLVPTSNMQISFTVTTSNASPTPGEGYTLVIGDPTLGATTKSLGAGGQGLGAEGIPGLAITFNTDNAAGGWQAPFFANTFSQTGAWANPWIDIDTAIGSLVTPGVTTTHAMRVSVLSDSIDVTMDGIQIFHGDALLPPVAYVYFTAANGTSFEQVAISNVTAIFSPQ